MPVVIRIFLRRAQGLVVYHVDLDVISVLGEVGAEYGFDDVDAFFPSNDGWIEALIQ